MKTNRARRYAAPGTVPLAAVAVAVSLAVAAGSVWWYTAARHAQLTAHDTNVTAAQSRELSVSAAQRERYGVVSAAEVTDAAGETAAYTVVTEIRGYKSTLRIRSTFTAKNLILAKMEVLAQEETEYLGERIATEGFAAAFVGRQMPLKLWGSAANASPVDGLTGATVSSQAVVDAVNNAYRYVQESIR